MKLIDADVLMKEHIPDRGEPDEAESKSWNFYYGYACALSAVGDVIRNMPPYEPDNACAEWIEESDRVCHWRCSNCGKVYGLASVTFKFCPECGKKMNEHPWEEKRHGRSDGGEWNNE